MGKIILSIAPTTRIGIHNKVFRMIKIKIKLPLRGPGKKLSMVLSLDSVFENFSYQGFSNQLLA
jgi:hypothetical protein